METRIALLLDYFIWFHICSYLLYLFDLEHPLKANYYLNSILIKKTPFYCMVYDETLVLCQKAYQLWFDMTKHYSIHFIFMQSLIICLFAC